MDRVEFVRICNLNLKPVRNEFSFSQEKMAYVLGISKKTLVEIEKERSSLGWAVSVVLCTVFHESKVLSDVFGGKHGDILLYLAFHGSEPEYAQTLGGKIWWETVTKNDNYIIQQNIVTRHYRLLDSEGKRVASSIDLDDLAGIFSSK